MNTSTNPRRAQLGRLVMYAVAFGAGYLTQTTFDRLTSGLVFLGLFAPVDAIFEFLFGLVADYREQNEAAEASAKGGRLRRGARRVNRLVKATVPATPAAAATSTGPGPTSRRRRR
jgi:hypothetical protein